MDHPVSVAYITAAGFVALAAFPWLIITAYSARAVRRHGFSTLAQALATAGLATGLISYFTLYVSVIAVTTAELASQGFITALVAAIAKASSFQLMKFALLLSLNPASALLIVPPLSGVSAAVTAVITAATIHAIPRMKHVR